LVALETLSNGKLDTISSQYSSCQLFTQMVLSCRLSFETAVVVVWGLIYDWCNSLSIADNFYICNEMLSLECYIFHLVSAVCYFILQFSTLWNRSSCT
jgi:hypothetical protein